MKMNRRSPSGTLAAWLLVVGLSLAMLHGPSTVVAEEDIVGGRVSRMCHAGLWLVRHGHLISGGGLIWLGC